MELSNIYLKLENLQPSGSFKSRGIGNFMLQKLKGLVSQETGPGERALDHVHFYSSSGGNAGLACVHAAVTLGCRASVIVPLTTTSYMIAKLREAGAAEVIQHGASWQEADQFLTGVVMAQAQEHGETAIYVPPFDAPEIWAGNSLLVHESVQQLDSAARHYQDFNEASSGASQKTIDSFICSVGGGGLFCGVMQGIDELGLRNTRVAVVETQGADSLAQSVAKKELVTLPAITSIATSLGARTVCKQALEYGMRSQVSTVVLTDSEALQACRRLANEERLLVEPACGASVALCYGGQLSSLIPDLTQASVVVVVLCGGSNVSLDILAKYADESNLV